MNKTELVWSIADRTDIPCDAVERMLSATMESIMTALAADEKIVLPGFGSFSRKLRPARRGHNPKTGEEIAIPACWVPAFRAGKKLKDSVNSGWTA